MNTCINCKHHREFGPKLTFICKRILTFGEAPLDTACISCNLDEEGKQRANLLVSPDFGCTLFEVIKEE